MSLRFVKWLIIVLIAAALVIALDHFLQSGTAAALPGQREHFVHQNAEMAATPTAPACQASSRSRFDIPPSA